MGGLQVLVDSTSIKMLCEGEWKTQNMVPNIVGNGAKSISVLMLKTLKIHAIEVMSNAVGDAQV
jgi:hypothetical protein